MSITLKIHNSQESITPCSFEIRVDADMANRLEAASQTREVVAIVIGRKEIVEWMSPQRPVPTTRCFGFGMNLYQHYVQSHPSVHLSATVTGQVTKVQAGVYHTTMESGSVRLITRQAFRNLGPGSTDQLISPTTNGTFNAWLRALWNEPQTEVAGIIFGRDGFELDLITTNPGPEEPKRRRVSLIKRIGDSELWQLSSCGTGKDYLGPAAVLKQLRERVFLALKEGGFADRVRLVERRGRAAESPGVFYRRATLAGASAPQTLIRPDFGLLFTGEELRKTWYPETLKEQSGKLILHQQDEVQDAQQDGNGRQKTADLLFQGGKAALTQATLPALSCAGIRTGRLQEGKLWQFGLVTPQPPCLSEPMALWTRWDIPDRAEVRPPADTALLPLPLQESHAGWQVNLVTANEQAEPDSQPRLRMTLTPSLRQMQLELFDGEVTMFTPEVRTYVRRLQDPSSPPNEKNLSESLRPTRLVFGQIQATPTELVDDEVPTITIPRLNGTGRPVFPLHAEHNAIVSYAPHGRDAGIDYLSAGAKNLRQRVDTETLRTVVERDTTHMLTLFPINKCTLAPGLGAESVAPPVVTLTDVDWMSRTAEATPHLAAAMALAPWVSMHESVEANIVDPQTRVRSLHHRNLALEQGEFAAASLDRAADGIPRGLAENVEDFLKATRDEYTTAVESLPSKMEKAAEIINWLPGASLNNAPRAWIHYPLADAGLERAPVIHSDDTFLQSLHLRPGVADRTHQDWLTCDARLVDIHIDAENRPLPEVHVKPVNTNENTSAAHGERRARNGSVPWLFDGKDFSAVALDSSSRSSEPPLTWYVAADATGVAVVQRSTGIVEARLDGSAGHVVLVGTGRTTDADWAAALRSDGKVLSWQRPTGTSLWKASFSATTAGFSATVSAVVSNTDSVAILAVDSASALLRLWVWRPNPADMTPDVDVLESIADIVPSEVASVAMSFVDEALFIAVATFTGAPAAYQGTRDALGDWTFTVVTIASSDAAVPISTPACRVTLGFFDELLMLAAVKQNGDHWCLAEFQSGKFQQIDAVQIPSPNVASDVRLAARPSSNQGLPVGCRPGWVIIANDTGSLDLWLSTPEAVLHSVDVRLAAQFPEGTNKQPLVRFAGHPGRVLDLDAAIIQVEGTAGTRSGLLSCGDDGAVRLWNIDVAAMIHEQRADSCWMDNLGTLRAPQLERGGEHAWTQQVNRPLQVPTSRSAPSQYTPKDRSISLSIGHLPNNDDAETCLVRAGEGTSRPTEVFFTCESLRLQLNKSTDTDRWIPEPVQGDAPENFIAASRGYVGVYGFYSTMIGSNVPAADFLPRVAGVPMFFRDIEAMTFDSGGVDPWKIMSMSVAAVLINPLLMDGSGASLDDIRQGDTPSFLTVAIQEGSLVTVELSRNSHDVMQIDKVHSRTTTNDAGAAVPIPITWNMLIGDEAQRVQEEGFQGRLEQLTFTVSFDKTTRRILLHVVPAMTEVQLLDGSQPLEIAANKQLVLQGFGRSVNGKLFYGFESLRSPLSEDAASLPLTVTRPSQRFTPDAPIKKLATDDLGSTPDFVTSHILDDSDPTQPLHELIWWDSVTGLPRNRFPSREPVEILAYGRALTTVALFPDAGNSLEPRDQLKITRREVQSSGIDSFDSLRIPGSSTPVSAVCLVTGNSRSVIVAGDEAGTLHLLDAVTGASRSYTDLAAGAVEFLTSLMHGGRPMVAAVCEEKVWLIDARNGEILSELPIEADPGATYPRTVSLMSVGENLCVFALSCQKVRGWIWSGGAVDTENIDLAAIASLTIRSIAVGQSFESDVLFYTTNTGVLGQIDLLGTPSPVATGLPADSSIDFLQSDDNTRLLAAVAPNEQPIRFFTQVHTTGTWGNWTQKPTSGDPLSRFTGQVRFVRVANAVLAVTSPVNQRVTIDSAYDVIVVDTDTGASVAAVVVPMLVDSRWFFATEETWMPHCATNNGDAPNIDVYNLVSGRSRRLTVPGDQSCQQLSFADTGSATWLIAACSSVAHSLRLSGPFLSKTLDHEGPISGLSVSGPYAVVAGDGVTFWEIGSGESDATRRLKFAESESWSHVAVTSAKESLTAVKVAATTESKCFTWELNSGSDWSETERHQFDVASTILSLEYVQIPSGDMKPSGVRDHLSLAQLDDERQLKHVDILLPEDAPGTAAATRWRLLNSPLSELQVSVVRHPQLGILVGGGSELSLWRPNQFIAFNEQGLVVSQLDVDLKLKATDTGFGVAAQLLQTGLVQFAKHNTDFSTNTLLLPGLARQGMFCLIGDCDRPDRKSGTTALVLRREPQLAALEADQEVLALAGTVLQTEFLSREVTVSVNAIAGAGCIFRRLAELTQQTTRTFGPNKAPQIDRLISGRLGPTEDDSQPFEIHFADQFVTTATNETPTLIGMILFEYFDHRLQGPVLCRVNLVDNIIKQFEVEAGVYRVVPSRFEPDTLRSDYAFPTAGGLVHLDLSVPIPDTSNLSASFVQFFGSPAGIQLQLVGHDRIPLDLCLDSHRLPLPVSSSEIPQLAHRRGLGRRLRFVQNSVHLFQGLSSGAWNATGDSKVVWQMQPLLVGPQGLKLAEAGVIAEDGAGTEVVVTENVLAIVRPPAQNQPTANEPATNQPAMVCLATETGEPDVSGDLVSTKRLIDAVNRRILLRHTIQDAAPPVYSVVACQSVNRGGFQVRQNLRHGDSLPAADSRLLLHAAARRLVLDGSLDREVLPSTSSPELDNDLSAIREWRVRQANHRRSVERTKDGRDRVVCVQEATAFRDMQRLWYLPDALQPWVELGQATSAATSTPFHPASLRLRLAADKPGAMIHHRLQLAIGEPAEDTSTPAAIVSGPQLSFALREPMQLNPPLGASLELMRPPTLSPTGRHPWRRLEFGWKERLGTIPVRAAGDVVIEQLDSQLSDGVLPNEVEIVLLEESQNSLQLILQLNDQLIDLDRQQPLFPVYDARRAALANIAIDQDHDRLLQVDLVLESKIEEIDVLSLVGRRLIAATSTSHTRVWDVQASASPTIDPSIDSTIDWPEGSILRLGWWANRPVALTNLGDQTRLFDPFTADNQLKELTGDGAAPVAATALHITRLVSDEDGRLYDVAVALDDTHLNIWVELADQADINVEPKRHSIENDHLVHLTTVATLGGDALFLASWSSNQPEVKVRRLTIDEEGKPILGEEIKVSLEQPLALAMVLNGDESKPLLYCGRGDRTLAVIDDSGIVLSETTLAGVPRRLHAISDGGRPLVAVTTTDETNQESVVVFDGRTGQTLRRFDPPQGEAIIGHGAGQLLPLGEPVLACSVVQGQTNRVQLFRIALASIRPGNIFLLTKADPSKVFEPSVHVKVKNDAGMINEFDVPLTAVLVLLNASGLPVRPNPVELAKAFIKQSTTDGATLYRLNPETEGLSFSGAVAIRIEWSGTFEGRSPTKPLAATFDRDRSLRLLPYSATAAKMSAVLSVDKVVDPSHIHQILQRNLVFGDAADLSNGQGVLDPEQNGKQVFAFELIGKEQLDTPLPQLSDEDCRLVLSLAKYHIDGQVTGDHAFVEAQEKTH